MASYEPASEFSLRLLAKARRRGVGSALQVVFLSDGAAWTEDPAAKCFPGCASILDFYHASERINELARALDPTDAGKRALGWVEKLLGDGIGEVIEEARALREEGCADAPAADENLGFLGRNRHRMLYGTFRAKEWFVGSGVVEAGCKTVVGKRLKQSGMFWSEAGAKGVLNFHTLLLSRCLDDF